MCEVRPDDEMQIVLRSSGELRRRGNDDPQVVGTPPQARLTLDGSTEALMDHKLGVVGVGGSEFGEFSEFSGEVLQLILSVPALGPALVGSPSL